MYYKGEEGVVSIIIPIYNCQKYILRCLESVSRQSYNKIQIIVVDDGSTDGSDKICNSFCINDNRFNVLHKTNSGVSDTRNIGINNAKGKYLVFVDSDDLMLESFISKSVRQMNADNSEFLIGAFRLLEDSFLGNTIDYLSNNSGPLSINDYLKKMSDYHTEAFWGANWAKLYRTEIIRENNIKFESGVLLAEDFRFNLEYLKHVSRVSLLHDPIYAYRIDSLNSLSKKKREVNRFWDEYLELYHRYVSLFKTHEVYDCNKEKLDGFLLIACRSILRDCVSDRLKNINNAYRLLQSMKNTQEVRAVFQNPCMDEKMRNVKFGMQIGVPYLLVLYLLNKRRQFIVANTR